MSHNRRWGWLAAGLLAAGVLCMVVPALLRDGICGLLRCADSTPDIAVTRTAPGDLVILVPEGAAPAVRAVRLLQSSSGGSGGSIAWGVRREAGADRASSPTAFVVGQQPPGFRTTQPSAGPVAKGAWQAEVSFRCTTASLPFNAAAVGVGQVRSWNGTTRGAGFAPGANDTETCATEPGSVERALFVGGAVAAVVGALIGIVVLFRRDPPEPDDDLVWAPTADG
ncbi:MAG: hypothetical protein ACOYOP_14815 [Microthrixaceae bacterium]